MKKVFTLINPSNQIFIEQTNYPLPLVERPNGRYNGQKLIKLVITKTIANTPKIIATVPDITPK